jgi:uncharacterized repeat protein (TIGR03803 family)
LYAFQGPDVSDGQQPLAAPIMDDKGDLYGTTEYGGSYSLGVVYRLHRTKSGAWKESVLHSFADGTDGSHPTGGVVMDGSGNYTAVPSMAVTRHAAAVSAAVSSMS